MKFTIKQLHKQTHPTSQKYSTFYSYINRMFEVPMEDNEFKTDIIILEITNTNKN